MYVYVKIYFLISVSVVGVSKQQDIFVILKQYFVTVLHSAHYHLVLYILVMVIIWLYFCHFKKHF